MSPHTIAAPNTTTMNRNTPFEGSPLSNPALMYGHANGAEANHPNTKAMSPVMSVMDERRSL